MAKESIHIDIKYITAAIGVTEMLNLSQKHSSFFLWAAVKPLPQQADNPFDSLQHYLAAAAMLDGVCALGGLGMAV
jgi:hypothetical protein